MKLLSARSAGVVFVGLLTMGSYSAAMAAGHEHDHEHDDHDHEHVHGHDHDEDIQAGYFDDD
ncbi:hypothetical protein [Salinicola salarius]|uniref:hypothetical protein n=1 Tax=Salinicola salarius TaxID=430457 RepID=UPI001179DF41|nr:hypothetical protein [Salinicola salarius]